MKVICQNPACGREFSKPPRRLCKRGEFCCADCRRAYRVTETAMKRAEANEVPDGYITVRVACDILGISREAIRAKCARRTDCILRTGRRVFVNLAKLNEPTRGKPGRIPTAATNEQARMMIDEYQNGGTLRKLARKYQLSEAVVRQCLVANNCQIANPRLDKARRIFRSLTSEEREQLIKEHESA